MTTRVWIIYRGFDADVVGVVGSEGAAHNVLEELADEPAAFADEWVVGGKPTGLKLLNRHLAEEE